jgi:hypothetical protein
MTAGECHVPGPRIAGFFRTADEQQIGDGRAGVKTLAQDHRDRCLSRRRTNRRELRIVVREAPLDVG